MVTTTYELGILSGKFTGAANREDLLDVITMISPTDTPCFTSFRKTKVSNAETEWLTDALDAATSNAVTEGSSATFTDAAARVRLQNYCQISREAYDVSDTQRAVNPAGIKDEFAYQMGKALKQLKRDVEYDIISGSAGSGAGASTRCARGIYYFINQYAANSASASADISGAATEALLNDVLQAVWEDGGEPDWVLMDPVAKVWASENWTGSQNTRRLMPADSGHMTSVIDVYRSDFGEVKLIPHRWFPVGGATPDVKRTHLVLEKGKWMVGLLRPIKNTPLAKIGSSERAMVEAEWTLICLHPSAQGYISGHASA